VRVAGPVEALPAQFSDAYWASRPRASRIGAWASPQSAVLADRAALDRLVADAEERFAAARSRGRRSGAASGALETIEFWQGRRSRLTTAALPPRGRRRVARGAPGSLGASSASKPSTTCGAPATCHAGPRAARRSAHRPPRRAAPRAASPTRRRWVHPAVDAPRRHPGQVQRARAGHAQHPGALGQRGEDRRGLAAAELVRAQERGDQASGSVRPVRTAAGRPLAEQPRPRAALKCSSAPGRGPRPPRCRPRPAARRRCTSAGRPRRS
jgi:hypothetical protein